MHCIQYWDLTLELTCSVNTTVLKDSTSGNVEYRNQDNTIPERP